MARPAGRPKQYSRATDPAGRPARGRAGTVTGTATWPPSGPVSRSRAEQARAPSATATCDDATTLTLSVPHSSGEGPGRTGPEVYTSHRPALAPDAVTRSGGGAVTCRGGLAVAVLASGRAPAL